MEGLEQMYQNLHKKGLGKFQNASYFAGSAGAPGFVWAMDFGSGHKNDKAEKDKPRCARAARAF